MAEKKEVNYADKTVQIDTTELLAAVKENEENKEKHWYDAILNLFKRDKNKKK